MVTTMKPGDMVRLFENNDYTFLTNDDKNSFLMFSQGEIGVVTELRNEKTRGRTFKFYRIVTSTGNSGWIESYKVQKV